LLLYKAISIIVVNVLMHLKLRTQTEDSH